MSTQTFLVSGMTCDHCVHAVTSEIKALAPDASVEVVLGAPSTVTIASDPALSADQVAEALDEAGGYALAGTPEA